VKTRMLSRYRYFVDGKPPQTLAVSNVERHSRLDSRQANNALLSTVAYPSAAEG